MTRKYVLKKPKAMFPDDNFSHERRLSFSRSRAQARFRGEVWELTWEDYKTFWNTEERWNKRGRAPGNLVLTRFNETKPWSKDNSCIITRDQQHVIRGLRTRGLDASDCYKDAIYYGQ